jgi:O-antigen/teichoic acid export membrane protein
MATFQGAIGICVSYHDYGFSRYGQSGFDRILLEQFLPENFYPGRTSRQALGIYGNAYKLSIFMALSTQAFRYAAEPFFLSKNKDKNSTETLAEATKWFTIVCIFIWLGVCLNLDWLKKLFLRKAIYQKALRLFLCCSWQIYS